MQYEINKPGINYHKKMTNIEINSPCLGLFQTDSKLYRAIVLSKNDEIRVASIRYIDYGNCEEIKYEKYFYYSSFKLEMNLFY